VAAEIRLITDGQMSDGVASGGMSRRDAISAATCGATGIFTVLSRIAPGGRGSAHVHTNCESSIYVVSGRGRMMVGERLEEEIPLRPSAFLFVPPGAPHLPINDGGDDLVLVVSRNTAEEEVEEYSV
jgi:uncharacterized RmlC-like cupin family protein